MTVYVDNLFTYPTTLRHKTWCHMATDGDLSELHELAQRIGLKRSWFQNHATHPHYDLTPNKRALAIRLGAVPVSSQELVRRCSSLFKEN